MAINGGDRAPRAWALIRGCADGEPVAAEHVCRAVNDAADTDGAALSLSAGTDVQALVFATDEVARKIAELQFSLGEGPGLDAWTLGGASLAEDLVSAEAAARWPFFAPAAIEAGACAVFSFPLQAGAIRLGALEVYRAKAGPLSTEQFADVSTFAAAALEVMLHAAHPGPGSVQGQPLGDLGEMRAEVYQATGMVAVQMDAGLDQALVRLRARAFADGVGVADIARRVLARELRFGPNDAGAEN